MCKNISKWEISVLHCWAGTFMLVRDKFKHHENCKKLPWEHVIGCWGVKLFLLKYVTITTVTTATVTWTTVVFWLLFLFLSQLDFLSYITIWFMSFVKTWRKKLFTPICFFSSVAIQVFEACHNLRFLVLSQVKFLVLS